jgi:hypothetical protein
MQKQQLQQATLYLKIKVAQLGNHTPKVVARYIALRAALAMNIAWSLVARAFLKC